MLKQAPIKKETLQVSNYTTRHFKVVKSHGGSSVKMTRRGTTVPVYEFDAKHPKKEHKLGVKDFL